MSPDKQAALYAKYPSLFREKDLTIQESCMPWGCQCDDGWMKLIDETCAKLEAVKAATGIDIRVTGLKEKLGTLRLYWSSRTPETMPEATASIWWHILIDIEWQAEHQSASTCEVTGEYGELCARGGWFKTLCKEEAKKQGFEPYADWVARREKEEGEAK